MKGLKVALKDDTKPKSLQRLTNLPSKFKSPAKEGLQLTNEDNGCETEIGTFMPIYISKYKDKYQSVTCRYFSHRIHKLHRSLARTEQYKRKNGTCCLNIKTFAS